MLRRLEGKIVDGLVTVQANRATFKDLAELVKRDYKIKQRRSRADVDRRFEKHILPILGDLRALAITGDTISQYIEKRLDEGAAKNSIDLELASIKRAYSLARKNGMPITTPAIEMFHEKNPRQGFFREDHFRSALQHANPLLRDFLIVGYYTGWRHKSILKLEWTGVDWKNQVLRHRETKNSKATIFPLEPFPELVEALKRRLEAARGLITPWVFQRNGARVRSIRKAWEIAREKAGIPGRTIHDLRRTAVRNLKEAGWSDTQIMSMVGLKTLSMLLWYGISVEDDILRKAKTMAKIQHL